LETAETEQTFEKAARNWHVITDGFCIELKAYGISLVFLFWIILTKYGYNIRNEYDIWLQISSATILLNNTKIGQHLME